MTGEPKVSEISEPMAMPIMVRPSSALGDAEVGAARSGRRDIRRTEC